MASRPRRTPPTDTRASGSGSGRGDDKTANDARGRTGRRDAAHNDGNGDAEHERDSIGDPAASAERRRDLEATWIEPRQHSCAEKGGESDDGDRVGSSSSSSSSGGGKRDGAVDERKRRACKCVHVWVPAQTRASAFKDTRVCIPVDDATQTFSALDFQRRTGYTSLLRNRTPLEDRDVGRRQMVPIQQAERVVPRRSSRHETSAAAMAAADKQIDVRSLRNMLYNMANRWVRDNSHAEDWVGGDRALRQWENAHLRYLERHPLAGLDRDRLSRQGSFVQRGTRGGSRARSQRERDEDGGGESEREEDDDGGGGGADRAARERKQRGSAPPTEKKRPRVSSAATPAAVSGDDDDLRALATCMGPDCAASSVRDTTPDDSDVEALQRAFVGGGDGSVAASETKRDATRQAKTRATESGRAAETKKPPTRRRPERKGRRRRDDDDDDDESSSDGRGADADDDGRSADEDDVMRFRPRYAYADDVEIRKSRLPAAGQGVVTRRHLVAGQTIGNYAGTTVTRDELAHMNPRDARQMVTVVDASGNSHSVDADPAHFCGKINHLWREAVPRLGSANVEVTRDLHIVCLRDVDDGEELFYDYGPERWYYRQTGRDVSSIKDTRLRLQALEATVAKLPNPTPEWARTHLEPRRR